MVECFCTAARGTETFAVSELTTHSGVSEIWKTDGKVYFTAEDSALSDLLQLRTVERLFLQVLHQSDFCLHGNKDVQELGFALADMPEWPIILHNYQTYFYDTFLGKGKDDADDHEPCSAKRRKTDSSDNGFPDTTFRISCRLPGKLSRKFNAQTISKSLGYHLRKKHGWNVDMRNPFIEICVHIGSVGVTAGIPVTKKPLSLRPYVSDFGLRSTVAWIIAKLADIKPGDIVLDPMCGAATILLEASYSWPGACFIGSDSSMEQIERAKHNVDLSQMAEIQVLYADARCIPIKSDMVDALICDLPFGSKYLTVEKVTELLPQLLKEFWRVLKDGKTAVLLTSAKLKDKLISEASKLVEVAQDTRDISDTIGEVAIAPTDYASNDSELRSNTAGTDSDSKATPTTRSMWLFKEEHYLKLGETHASVCVFTKVNGLST